MKEIDNGDYILHADLLKIFAWMVEHQVAFKAGFGTQFFDWYDGEGWVFQGVPNGDFLAAIVKLMGGDDE